MFKSNSLTDGNDNVLATNRWSAYPKDVKNLSVPNMAVSSVSQSNSICPSEYDSCWKVTVTTDAVALFTWIEAIGNARCLQI